MPGKRFSPRIKTATWIVLVAMIGCIHMASAQDDDGSLPIDTIRQACESENPYLVTTCFTMGATAGRTAVVAFRDTPDESGHIQLATSDQVGSVWGLAYDVRRGHLYAAAFLKRAVAFGPGGVGAIYRMALDDGRVEHWATVPQAGSNPHDPSNDYLPDASARSMAGKVSLGDIDLDEDARWLYAVNLADRRIHRYRVSDGRHLGSFPHGAASEAWAEDEARPFALKVWGEHLYHGVVRDASTSGDRSDLVALVYQSRLDGAEMREVLRLPLTYERDGVLRGTSGDWLPWTDEDPSIHASATIWPEPWLTDIEFDEAGRMILGLRDRTGDRTLFEPQGALPPGERNGIPGGDLLLARRAGQRWMVSPDDLSHFEEDAGPGIGSTNGAHPETGFGGISRIPASDGVAMTMLSPLRIKSGGVGWYEVETGKNTRREELYEIERGINFGKANGLGDLETVCAPPEVPRTHRIYLSWVARARFCSPRLTRVDVALVLDMSTSMGRDTESGRTKHQAAIQAAHTLVDELLLEGDAAGRQDRVGIVGFNDTAWTATGLTTNRARARAALDGLPDGVAHGTRIDLALDEGGRVLRAARDNPGVEPVLILLSDGLPNRVPFPPGSRQEATVLASADALKARGIRVFAVGLGEAEDVLRPLLSAIASRPSMYYHAPDGEDLEAIYRQIAGRLVGCPPSP